MQKANHTKLTAAFLDERARLLQAGDWPVSKWITFAQDLLAHGYTLKLYEARKTFSKYLTVSKTGSRARPVVIHFSNHKPIMARELRGDCDFFVGVTHLHTTTTADARAFVEAHFQPPAPADPDSSQEVHDAR